MVSWVSSGSQAAQSSASVSRSHDKDWSPSTYGGGKLKKKTNKRRIMNHHHDFFRIQRAIQI